VSPRASDERPDGAAHPVNGVAEAPFRFWFERRPPTRYAQLLDGAAVIVGDTGGGNGHRESAGLELDGLTLGVVGLGQFARRVARIITALGVHVTAILQALQVLRGETPRFLAHPMAGRPSNGG
jgi:D-isomer specific 2-hydroxyacid dehydrogenase, NAD binding domain